MHDKIGKPNLRIVVVGAGPAGSSLSIRLALHGCDVTLIERERFPRHKLCGEFISPESMRHFADLGIRSDLLSAGGTLISKTRFSDTSGRSFTIPSRLLDAGEAALSLSRYRMDDLLLERAKDVGVRVLEGTRIVDLRPSGDRIVGVDIAGATQEFLFADLFVDATGRAAALTKAAARKLGTTVKNASPPRAVAFKAHLRNARIEPGTCEIFFFSGGYGGLTPIENGLANLCFIVDASRVRKTGADADSIVREMIRINPAADRCLELAERESDWLAVSIGQFGRTKPIRTQNLLSVGDAAAFIDPFTGSGMLMALESSELLADSIARAGDIGAIRVSYEAAHRRYFASRLRISSLLRRAASMPVVPGLAISLLSLSGLCRRYLAGGTRAPRTARAKII